MSRHYWSISIITPQKSSHATRTGKGSAVIQPVHFRGAAGAPRGGSLGSELLVRADLVGHDSQGVIRIPQYARAIQSALVQPGAVGEIAEESPSMALINGHGGLGQIVARRAMALAIRKAQETKISSVGAYNLYHVGRLADYTRMAAEQDLVGIMMVNGGNSSPSWPHSAALLDVWAPTHSPWPSPSMAGCRLYLIWLPAWWPKVRCASNAFAASSSPRAGCSTTRDAQPPIRMPYIKSHAEHSYPGGKCRS